MDCSFTYSFYYWTKYNGILFSSVKHACDAALYLAKIRDLRGQYDYATYLLELAFASDCKNDAVNVM